MNHCVPDFQMDNDYGIPTSGNDGGGGGTRPKKTAIGDEGGIIELLWQDGQVVLHSQNQRSPPSFKRAMNGTSGDGGEIRSFENVINISHHHHRQQQLFMQEDEMASWLHYPLSMDDTSFADHRELYSDDLLYPPPSAPAPPSSPPRQFRSIVTEIRPLSPPPPPMATPIATRASRPPPIPTPPAKEAAAAAPPSRFQNFTYFSRLPKSAKIESGPSSSARELTVVDSNETPALGTESRVSSRVEGDSTAHLFSHSGGNVTCGTMSGGSAPVEGTSTAAGELTAACERTVTSLSPGASGGSGSASAEPTPQTIHKPAEDRKRKGIETDDTECHSEDVEVEFESGDGKKKFARGSTSTKRSRAAEVHNLSERRRRDRINERMKALQELIPRCNKSDKASMLDEAIEYLKSLQLQVQMMSMGCGMMPLMYPGCMPGMGMGMGMGMEMGVNRPLMPYASLIPPPGMPNPAVAFHMQQGPNQMDPNHPMMNSLVAAHNPNQPRMPNFADPYQQFVGLQQQQQQAQMSLPQQNQVALQPNKPSSSRGVGNPENHESG